MRSSIDISGSCLSCVRRAVGALRLARHLFVSLLVNCPSPHRVVPSADDEDEKQRRVDGHVSVETVAAQAVANEESAEDEESIQKAGADAPANEARLTLFAHRDPCVHLRAPRSEERRVGKACRYRWS